MMPKKIGGNPLLIFTDFKLNKHELAITLTMALSIACSLVMSSLVYQTHLHKIQILMYFINKNPWLSNSIFKVKFLLLVNKLRHVSQIHVNFNAYNQFETYFLEKKLTPFLKLSKFGKWMLFIFIPLTSIGHRIYHCYHSLKSKT